MTATAGCQWPSSFLRPFRLTRVASEGGRDTKDPANLSPDAGDNLGTRSPNSDKNKGLPELPGIEAAVYNMPPLRCWGRGSGGQSCIACSCIDTLARHCEVGPCTGCRP